MCLFLTGSLPLCCNYIHLNISSHEEEILAVTTKQRGARTFEHKRLADEVRGQRTYDH